MADPAAALEAIGAANEARAYVWTALHTAEHELTRQRPPNLPVVRVALEQAVEACDRTRAMIVRAQAEAAALGEWKGVTGG